MSVEDLDYDLVALRIVGAIFTTKVCVRGVNVVIQQRILLIDFTIFLMREFDAIFSMD